MQASSSESITFPVVGMTCAACQHHVEAALKATAGVQSARVDLMANRVSVSFDPAIATPQKLIHSIQDAGYDAVLPRTGASAQPATGNEGFSSAWVKAWVALAAGAVAMIVAMPLDQTDPAMGWVDHLLMRVAPWLYAQPLGSLRWALLVLTATVVMWAGRAIYENAFRALIHRSTNMNTLVSLGTLVAFAWSAYSTLLPAAGRQVYFDAVLLIVGFLLLGKALEARAKRCALAALDRLTRLRPTMARRVIEGAQVIVLLDEIQPGNAVLVLPGERFPVDAIILEGRTSVDESMLTGEPTPQPRGAGDRVLAGTLNYDGAVTCQAQSLGEATMLAQITRMVEQAQSSRAPMERLADRASSIFVPIVLGLAVCTFVVWVFAVHSVSLAMANAVAVLVVACPCAMGLAVPAALTVAVGRGAQIGVLFKGGEALERLARLDVVVLDKTGTLTVGHPALFDVQAFGGRGEQDLLRLAAAAEDQSNHPLAHAVVDRARSLGLSWRAARNLQVYPGRGLSAQVEEQECLLGNEALMQEFFVALPDEVRAAAPGVTRLWMALNNAVAGYLDAKDLLQPDAAQAVAALRGMTSRQPQMRIMMLTGDSAGAAGPIARQAGISEFEAGMDPAGKLARIRELQAQGLRVAMVGDGINDAAALAQADAGIAMGSGTALAQDAGDVVLLRAQPATIPAAIGLARATLRIMRQNLGWAIGYNLLGIPLAAGALYPHFHLLLTPWLAAAAMALSSICVLANSLRLRNWQAAA